MFLLSDMMLKLQPKILDMKPGTRVVSNSFYMDDWPPDETEKLGGLQDVVHGAPVDRAREDRRAPGACRRAT